MSVVLLALAALGAPVLGAWLHELTHAAAAWVLGGEVVTIDLLYLHVGFRFEPRAPIRERLVLLAPAIVGVAIAPIALLNWGGEVTPWTLVGVIGWVVYTLNGGTQGELRLSVGSEPSVDSR
ncbi:hypothetical protein [Natrinema sp. CGMCC1.2065]|uniref:hypothetical protein n=1 Tax=Natrinema sp. CGMCC1.2065 TaxID=3445767 RepID=UPI003F49EB32